MKRKAAPTAVFDLRGERRRRTCKRLLKTVTFATGGLAVGGAMGAALLASSAPRPASAHSPDFAVCGLFHSTCVIDGDTIWVDGTKIRIADIDTPEISEPRCDWEYRHGIKARDRLVVLLNQGAFQMQPIGDRDEDRYGRKLRILVSGGVSIGDQLVSEGLARTWTGRRQPWC